MVSPSMGFIITLNYFLRNPSNYRKGQFYLHSFLCAQPFRILFSFSALCPLPHSLCYLFPPSKPPPRLPLLHHAMRHALCALLVDSPFPLPPSTPCSLLSAFSFELSAPFPQFRIPHSHFPFPHYPIYTTPSTPFWGCYFA